MTLRSFTGTLSRAHLLNPCRFPGVAWAIISHKLLRWFTPYLIVLFFISNLLLVHFAVFYQMTIVLQILFFLGATTGYVLDGQRIRLPLISTVYAFVVMNLGVAIGVTQAFLGHRIVAYQSE